MTLDWTDAASIMALTVVLFQHDFNIDFRMPLHHLCPPLPRSLNYIHWIGELLGEQPLPLEQQLLTTPSSLSSSSSSSLPSPGGRLIHGLDIGTGASCVFPLLGYSTYRWRFTGSEVDEESVQSSRETLSRNGLQDVIKVYHNKDRSKILAGVLDRLTTEDVSSDHTAETEHTTDKSDPTDALAEGGSDEEEKRVDEKENETSETEGERARRSKYRFDFVMCNPPFFDEMGQTGLNKKRACQATASELVCPGGEYAFVSQMVLESRQFAGQVRWFTSMVGRKGTLQKIERMLKTASLFTQTQTPVQHVTQCTFSQGKQARWAIAWTFDREEKERQMQKLRQEFVKQQEAKLRRQYQGKRSIDFTVHLTSSPSTASFLSVSAPSSSASSLSSASTFFAGVAEVMGCIQRGASLHAEGLNRADSSTVYASETSVDDDGWVLEGRLTRETAVSVSVGTAEQKRVCSGTSTADIGSALPPVLSNSALLSSSSPDRKSVV